MYDLSVGHRLRALWLRDLRTENRSRFSVIADIMFTTTSFEQFFFKPGHNDCRRLPIPIRNPSIFYRRPLAVSFVTWNHLSPNVFWQSTPSLSRAVVPNSLHFCVAFSPSFTLPDQLFSLRYLLVLQPCLCVRQLSKQLSLFLLL